MLLAWGESRGIMALLRILLAPQQGQAPRRLALPGVRSICRLRQTWRQTPKSPIPISLDSRFGREMGRKSPFPDSAANGIGVPGGGRRPRGFRPLVCVFSASTFTGNPPVVEICHFAGPPEAPTATAYLEAGPLTPGTSRCPTKLSITDSID